MVIQRSLIQKIGDRKIFFGKIFVSFFNISFPLVFNSFLVSRTQFQDLFHLFTNCMPKRPQAWEVFTKASWSCSQTHFLSVTILPTYWKGIIQICVKTSIKRWNLCQNFSLIFVVFLLLQLYSFMLWFSPVFGRLCVSSPPFSMIC